MCDLYTQKIFRTKSIKIINLGKNIGFVLGNAITRAKPIKFHATPLG